MAFMVPIVQNDWNLYGTNRNSRRGSQQTCSSSVHSGSHSQASSGFSRPASFGGRVTSPAAPPCNRRSLSGSSGLSSGQRSVTFGPPSPPAHAHHSTTSSSKAGFHAKVVDKLMKAIRKDDGRRT